MSTLTPENMNTLNACQSDDDWNNTVAAIKKEHGGYPSDWYEKMLATGLMDKIVGRFGKAGFSVQSFGTTDYMANALEGKPTLSKPEVLGLPPHAVSAEGVIQMAPVQARLRSIGHAKPELPPEVCKVCGLLADYMDNRQGLVAEGVMMTWATFEYDLSQGVHGFTGKPLRDPLAGVPPFIHALSMLAVRDIFVECLPEQSREAVQSIFQGVDDALIEGVRARKAADMKAAEQAMADAGNETTDR